MHHFAPFPKNPTIAKFFIQLGRVDELGSGVINVNRFIKEYAEYGKPIFSEGNTFRMSIPYPIEEILEPEKINIQDFDGAFDGAFGGAAKKVKLKLTVLIKAIAANEGNRAPDYIMSIDVSERTMERYLRQLKEADLIEFRGEASQIGGYYLTKKTKDMLK